MRTTILHPVDLL